MLPSVSIPLFFRQNIPLYHRSPAVILGKEEPPTPPPSTCQLASNYHAVKVLTNPCFPPGRTPAGHTTRAGKDSHSIMIIIIIMISIRLIYILKNTHKNTV